MRRGLRKKTGLTFGLGFYVWVLLCNWRPNILDEEKYIFFKKRLLIFCFLFLFPFFIKKIIILTDLPYNLFCSMKIHSFQATSKKLLLY